MGKEIIIALSLAELRNVLETAENLNEYHDMSHTVLISRISRNGSVIELLPNYHECSSATLLRRN